MASERNRTQSRVVVAGWLLALLACALPPGVVIAGDDAPPPLLGGYIRESRIVYPLTVQDWHAQGEHRYEQPEAGVSVRYAHDAADAGWLDVYVYPVGEIGADMLDTHMAQTVADLEGAAGQGNGRQIRFDATQAVRLPLEGVEDVSADGELRSAGGRMVREDAVFHTALAVALRQYYFIKGRYSVPEDAMSTDAARAALAGFLARFVQHVRISSTGSCGASLPIVVVEPHLRLPATGLLESSRDDRVRAVLTGDYRVLTYTPDDPEVLLPQGAGKLMRDDRYPGCGGETPIEPEVPEDHREIRIEYRAPASSYARASVG